MKRFMGIFFMFLILASCARIKEESVPGGDRACYPEGTPVTMNLSFGTPDFLDVKIGTKAEASAADESRVRELYVMLFDQDGNKFYGRNFSYSQKSTSLEALEDSEFDCWYVETDNTGITTRGVVKLSTVSKPNCTLIVLANVSNTISHIGTSSRVVDYLAGITTLNQLKASKVTLEQDIVTRSDLFLMKGELTGVYTGELIWGELSHDELPDTYYGHTYTEENDTHTLNKTEGTQVELKTIDAKIKFRVKYNTDNIDPERSYSRNWKVYNVPTSCYLFEPTTDALKESSADDFFSTEDAFFDGSEADDNGTPGDKSDDFSWEVFTFYMLENFQTGLGAEIYHDREKQDKNPDPVHDGYVENGDWVNAPANGTYVWFDMVLGLTSDGVTGILGENDIAQAITSKAAFTVHLGDFATYGFNDYTVKRNHCYTYNVTIENTSKIYVEVDSYDPNDPYDVQTEDQPGQEGSLLLVTEGIVNCDAHYEYHKLQFEYSEDYLNNGISWYIKTPFSNGGDDDCEDYLWVMFAVNADDGSDYLESRLPYPVNPNPDDSWYAYDPAWDPTSEAPRPPLMDIKQLVKFIINETRKQSETGSSAYMNGVILVTAYVDEYYYEFDPREYKPTNVEEVTSLRPAPNPELWRQFVNKPPRELHILANTKYSQDRQSDVILANNSIIQQSIQTFYNIYSPSLTSLWGTEHLDEMEYRTRHNKLDNQVQWPWWPLASEGYFNRSISSNPTDAENGRINTARIWDLPLVGDDYPSWSKFLDYGVNNNTPELKSGYDENGANYNSSNDYKFLAYSCLTRNRDNNHNGVIDPEEVRWYTASVNQLVGMWVGNESLTPSARLYHPMNATDKTDGTKWRSWVISSTGTSVTNPKTIRAEEGCTKSDYNFFDWAFGNGTTGQEKRNKVSSIRCVRNIGTYLDGGTLKDISYAPYDRMVDQYYEFPAGSDANGKVNANQDGTYTIRFSRLNPMSIREYTDVDLPYHDEFSIHNCVYQEMVVQDKTQYKYADGSMPSKYPEDTGDPLDEEVLNDAITAQGHNYYCPDGYRLPNMTELLLMESLLKSDFWGGSVYPCRTYYSHGVRGNDPVDSETGEKKIGWVKQSGRVHIINQNTQITGIRCVRDENRTGVITGVISVDDANKLMHSTDDEDRYMNVRLNISSLGSAISSLDISLVYVSAGGLEETISVTPEDLSVSGVSVRKEVKCKIPKYDDLPILGNISVRVTVANHAAIHPTVFEAPITLLSPVFTSIRLLHCKYDENAENPPFPVLVTASSASGITSMSLKVVDPDGISNSYSIFTGGGNSDTYKSFVHNYLYRTDNAQDGSAPVLIEGTYTFQLEVVSGGQTTRSDVATMEVFLVNKTWNKTYGEYDTDDDGIKEQIPWTDSWWQTFENANAWHNSLPQLDADATKDFRQKGWISEVYPAATVTDLDFFEGDFIETNMDVSNCTFIRTVSGSLSNNPQKSQVVGLDNIFSIGKTAIDWQNGATNELHFYYPAHINDGDDQLQIDPVLNGGYEKQAFGALDGGKLLLLLDQDGIKKNGSPITWNDAKYTGVVNALINSNTLHIGALEGNHRTRATYLFVRAVHNGSSQNSAGGDTNFGNDPVNGGDL